MLLLGECHIQGIGEMVTIDRKTYDVGYASGVFDMFHVGHLNLLRRARHRCHHLVVGVASDEYVELLKGRPPVAPCDERIDIISALGIVDEVVIELGDAIRVRLQARSATPSVGGFVATLAKELRP